jgi:predicted nuclease of predicted toxin-antitoxin system
VIRVLLDENLPRKLRRIFPNMEVRTVQEEGWTSYKNGELLRRAQERFDVLLTADRSMQFQQKIDTCTLGVVVIVTTSLRFRAIATAVRQLTDAIETVRPGAVIRVNVAGDPS